MGAPNVPMRLYRVVQPVLVCVREPDAKRPSMDRLGVGTVMLVCPDECPFVQKCERGKLGRCDSRRVVSMNGQHVGLADIMFKNIEEVA